MLGREGREGSISRVESNDRLRVSEAAQASRGVEAESLSVGHCWVRREESYNVRSLI